MAYILMHKNIKVMKFELSSSCYIDKIIEIYDHKHLPFSTERDITTFKKGIDEWWAIRSIPLSRDDYSNIQKNLPGDTPFSLVVKAHALSLNDQYWIRKEDEYYDYDDISLFTNKYSNDVGDIIIGIKESNDINYYSPDSTSNGNLKKRWKTINGKNYLLKAGNKPHQYEIFNEIIASKIMDLLDIEHVKYELFIDNGHIYSASSNFISYNEDFVTAYQLKCSKKQRNDISLYNQILSIYKSNNIPDYKTKLNQMLFIDYLVGNTDRHFNNFGVIRDAKSLEFLCVAPIYDTGACLGYDLLDQELLHLHNVDWKPFRSQKIETQLDLIDDYSWLDIEVLKKIPKEIDSLLLHFSEYINISRRIAILTFLLRRINVVLHLLGDDTFLTYDVAELSLLEREIIAYAQKHNDVIYDLSTLEKETGYSYITIYRAMSNLVNKGLLTRTGARKNGYWKIAN